MNEELTRTLDELRARASEEGSRPEGVERLLETIHGDEHAGAHFDGEYFGGDGLGYETPQSPPIVRHRVWMKRNPP